MERENSLIFIVFCKITVQVKGVECLRQTKLLWACKKLRKFLGEGELYKQTFWIHIHKEKQQRKE